MPTSHRRRGLPLPGLALLLVLTASLSPLVAGSALGWSPAGHMALGAIVYQELERIDPEALEAVVETLEHHPHHGVLLDGPDDRILPEELRDRALLMRATRWADDVRSEPFDEYNRPRWHYVNYRYRPPEELAPPRTPERDGYLLWALEENVRRLGSDDETVRAIALTWLFHLVTDLHQPLHAIALIDAAHPNGDRGGNLSYVRVEPGGETLNLHWFWDGLIHRSEEVMDSAVRADRLRAAVEVEAALADRPPAELFRAWAEESARVAMEHVYLRGDLETGTEDDGVPVSTEYLAQATEVASERAALGAVRLAQLLARLF